MKITPEFIDAICPTHGRTSCDDEHIYNGDGGWTGGYNWDGTKEIKYPRCIRCYLTSHLGYNFDELDLKLELTFKLY